MHSKSRELLSAAVVALGLLAASAHGQTPPPAPAPAPAPADAKPAEPYTITGNFGIYSQYIFRGLTQTNGFYLGTWGSNISWLHDSGVCNHGCSLEWDMYGGYKYAFNDDWGIDVGILYYYYPGSYVSGVTKPNTTELYVAGSWKWASLKYSHSVDDTFGIPNSKNSWYLDASANYPINDVLTLNAHVGRQEYKGSNGG